MNHKLWSAKFLIENPEAVKIAHLAYLEAGAQCISTISYQATIPGFIEMGFSQKEAEALILKSVQIASDAVQTYLESNPDAIKPLIAASMGPYGAYLSDGSEYHGNYGVSNDTLYKFHIPRIKLLDSTDADLLAFETIPSVVETQVIAQILENVSTKAWISFSCKDGKHLNDGTLIRDAVHSIKDHPNIFAVGVNCTPPKFITSLIGEIKDVAGDKRIMAYPNSGEVYDANQKDWLGTADPGSYLELAKIWLEQGAEIIGGCCRIGPEQIRTLRDNLIPH